MDDEHTAAAPLLRSEPRILLVSPHPAAAEMLREGLSRTDLRASVHGVSTANALAARLTEDAWDLVVIGAPTPSSSSAAALALTREFAADIPVVVLLPAEDADGPAVDLLRAGADEVVAVDRPQRLAFTVERLLHEASTRRARRVAEHRMRRLAYHDVITELPNLNGLRDRLPRARVEAGGELTLAVVQLHHLARLTEVLETRHLDWLLRSIVFRFASIVRPPASLAHVATGTLVACLPGASPEAASRVAEALIGALAAPLQDGPLRVRVEATAGVAFHPKDGATVDTLVRRGQQAAEEARRRGERVRSFDHDATVPTSRRQRLLTDLWGAAERGELSLQFKPLVNVHLRRTLGFEAVPRWRHPHLGDVPASEFILTAAHGGNIRELTRWILQESLGTCARWQEAGLQLGARVSLAAPTVADAGLPATVASELAAAGLLATALTLAIPLSALVDTPLATQRALAQLAAMEVSTVLDGPAGAAGRAERGDAAHAPAGASTEAGEGPARFPPLTPDSVDGWLQHAGYPPAR